MRDIYGIELQSGSKEEKLPGFETEFPYIASHVFVNRYPDKAAPWHWHRAVELFYVESGSIDYFTPDGTYHFRQGDCGFVNSNILHQTRSESEQENLLMLHLFDPYFISGDQGSRIAKKYVLPIISTPAVDVLIFQKDQEKTKKIVEMIQNSFTLQESEPGFELKMREKLSGIWLAIFLFAEPLLKENQNPKKANSQIKDMMGYIHEHYTEKINVAQIAGSAFLSERECYRIFQKSIHMSPVEYLTNYRVQEACRRLAGRESLTSIAQNCGFGSSSYFGKIFREYMGCTPLEYKKKTTTLNSR